MTRTLCLPLMVALLAVGCTPRIVVRPGGAERPTLFRVRTDARAVVLSGTMTSWRPRPLLRRGAAFELALDVPPGRYEYRLEVLDNSGVHAVFLEGGERTEDGFGGENAVLRVR